MWIDKSIRPGNDWRADIAEAIDRCTAFVFILSPHSLQSRYCREELYFAHVKAKPVFPILTEQVWGLLHGGVKLILQRIQWIQVPTLGAEGAIRTLVQRVEDLNLGTADETSFSWRRLLSCCCAPDPTPSSPAPPPRLTPRMTQEREPVERAKEVASAPIDVYVCYDVKHMKDMHLAQRLTKELKRAGFTVQQAARVGISPAPGIARSLSSSVLSTRGSRRSPASTASQQAVLQLQKQQLKDTEVLDIAPDVVVTLTRADTENEVQREESPLKHGRSRSMDLGSPVSRSVHSSNMHSSHTLEALVDLASPVSHAHPSLERLRSPASRSVADFVRPLPLIDEEKQAVSEQLSSASQREPTRGILRSQSAMKKRDSDFAEHGERDVNVMRHDLWERNARMIDNAALVIFVVCQDSALCADEVHYAYELQKPILQVYSARDVRAPAPAKKTNLLAPPPPRVLAARQEQNVWTGYGPHLLRGSLAVMLQRAPAVSLTMMPFELACEEVMLYAAFARKQRRLSAWLDQGHALPPSIFEVISTAEVAMVNRWVGHASSAEPAELKLTSAGRTVASPTEKPRDRSPRPLSADLHLSIVPGSPPPTIRLPVPLSNNS